MTHFNLIKSLTKNLVNSNRLLILCLSLAVFGVNDAWAWCGAQVNVYSDPNPNGGYVYVNTSKSGPGTYSKTSDDAQQKNGTALSAKNFTFYLYAQAKQNYTFKGWAQNTQSNTVNYTTREGQSVTVQGKVDVKYTEYNYYAIFARMTADISSKDFGNVNVGQPSDITITVTHAHASKITAALSGTNAGDFLLSKTTVVENSVSEGTATFTVTFKPTCNGARSATLTLSSTNGLSDVTISLSGTGVLNAQSLSWNNESAIELNMLNGATQNISATATSGLIVSYSSSNSGVLSVDATGKLTAKSVGEATITASQSGDCTYSAANSISKTFNVKSKDTPIFTPAWTSTDLKVGDKVTLGVQYVSDGSNGNFKAAYNSTIFNVTREGNTITIEALNEGNASVTFTQTETDAIFAASQTYSFTVSKIANTLAADATHSMKVDETWGNVISGKNSDATVTTTTSDETVAYYDVANNKIVAQNTNNQSFTSKEVTITISQAATYKYTAAEKTITVTVNKHDNHISINSTQDNYATSIYMDAQHAINLTATNMDYSVSPITATQTAGNTIAALNAAQTQVTSNHNLGDATWTVFQPENYKYKAANASFTIHVVKEAEETCYVKEDLNSDHEFSEEWSMTWEDENAAQTLTFRAKCQAAWTYGLYVCQYINGSWSEAKEGATNTTYISYDDLSTSYQSFEIALNKQAKGVKFVRRGTLKRTVRDVRVTRKTYLNAADVTVDKNANNNPVHPGETGENNLIINYSLATNGDDLKITWDNNLFTIDGHTSDEIINLGDKGCSTGTATLKIKYTSINPGTHEAHVVIYNNVYRTPLTITGKTVKRDQDVTWEEHSEIMMRGQMAAPVSTTLGNVIYTSDDPSIIKVINDGTAIQAVSPGTTTISVFSAGNSEFNDVNEEREITVTNQVLQFINWNQSLIGLKLGDSDVTLRASASQPDSLVCVTDGQRPITYHSNDESIVQIVNNNQLKIVGIGTTTITATQAGGMDTDGHDFIAVTAEKKVVVRDPNAPCETYIYTQGSEVKFDLGWNAASHQTKTYEIDFKGQEPGFVNFDYRGEAHKVLIDYYAGNLIIEQFVNGQWVVVKNLETPTKNGIYVNTGNLELNRKATKISIKANDGMGYMYFRDCQVTLARYIETTPLNTFETKVGSPVSQTAKINYSNISNTVTLSLTANSNFTIDKTIIDGTCGDYGSEDVTITYKPTDAREEEQATLTISDGLTTKSILIIGTATVTPLHIAWNIPATNSCYTVDQVTLNAQSLSDLNIAAGSVFYTLHANSTTGKISGNQLTFDKAGTAYVIANTAADSRYNPATSITKSWTVSKTPTTVTTKPTISGDVVSGTDIASLVLNDGAAQNIVNNQTVEGAFAITAGNLVNVGQQTLTITFTPNNTDMYEGCTTTITVNVVQREATADEVGIPSAAPITYGNAINTSLLSGNGSLAGEWTWVDEEANKAIPNAGTIDNLNVIFTPNDGNIKPVATTVSLTVNKAQPVISWTGETTYEWGEIANLFSASNDAAVTMTSLNESVAKIQDNKIIPVSAGTVTIHGEIEENDNYLAASLDQTITINAPADNTFTNAAGDNNWNNPANWTSGIVPEKLNDVDVVVNGEMTIDEEIHVNSLTIESGASVKVVVNGDLTVQGQSQERIEYGDLFVKNGGEVILPEDNSHKMMVHNLVIESSIGTSNGTSTSGQISNLDALAFDNGGDAYIDINLDPSGNADDSQWYCFTVPFPVDIATGIARKEQDGSFKVLHDHTNFDILRYNPTQRLNTGKGWEYYHGTLQPGEFYLIAIDGTNNVYSFRKKKDAALISANTMSLAVNGDNTNVNANWNAVGNPTLQKVTASFSNKIVQVYVNGGSRYQAVSTDDANFVVGCPFFIQASVAENLTLTADNSKSQFYAPARQDDNTNTLFCVRFGQNNHFSDQIFVTASEQALNQYEIGYDVAKIGVSKQSAQLWVNAYNQQLCAHEAVLTNDLADMALTLFAPKAGEYNLSVARENMPTDETLYLTQNGQIIWNLSESDYTIEAAKGDNNQYGLRLISSHRITTDNEQLESRNRAEKFIMNNQLYILRDGQLYDATGKKIQ